MNWFDKKNKLFSLIVEDNMTNGEVIAVQVGIITLIVMCGFAEWLTK